MEHEEALVASLTIELSGNIDSLESLIAASLERLVHQLKDQGALIGHIKAALTCITPVMTFASVGDNLNTKAHQPISYKLEASSIVFNIDKMSLRTLVRNLATHLGTPLSS
ncbi:MAG: hypothetical protein FWF71_04045 [Actinomycetia bacterium]|nr:hypothetical protein [Actinomycetes bacterium]